MYPVLIFHSGTGLEPVVRASRLICAVMSCEGRFRTHFRVRSMFCVVWDIAAKPIMQRWPSHQAEDMGEML